MCDIATVIQSQAITLLSTHTHRHTTHTNMHKPHTQHTHTHTLISAHMQPHTPHTHHTHHTRTTHATHHTHSPTAPTVRLAVEAVSPNCDSRYLGANAVIPDTTSSADVIDRVMNSQLRLDTTSLKWVGKVLRTVRRSVFSLVPYLLLYVLMTSLSRSSFTRWLSGSRRGNRKNGIEVRIDTTPVDV